MTFLIRSVLGVLLVTSAAMGFAQGPPGQDPYNPPPGHGGVPPGQAKKQRYGNMPPGQAKKYGDWHFRHEDRDVFYSHYQRDAGRWRGRRRPVFVVGQPIPYGYAVTPVPRSYWQGAPPPPPGYRYGYYGGYVVAYDPSTRITVDVLDLIGAATSR